MKWRRVRAGKRGPVNGGNWAWKPKGSIRRGKGKRRRGSTIIHQDQQSSTKINSHPPRCGKRLVSPKSCAGQRGFPLGGRGREPAPNPFPGGSLSFSFLGRLTNELGECRITRKPWSLRRLTRETLIKAKVLGWGTGALDWSGACVIIGLILYGGGRRPPRARDIFYFHC